MKQTLIIANWKSNKSFDEVVSWMDGYESQLQERTQLNDSLIKVLLAPPMSSLLFVSNRLLDKQKLPNTYLTVQDISPFPAGSYTGGISARNLDGFRVRYAIVGHSERRKHFHESHQDVAEKIRRCLEAEITPILCLDDEYIADQSKLLSADERRGCVVAYEDLESIGTGEPQPIEKVADVVSRIRVLFEDSAVLYGGSVKESNIQQYLSVSDGVIVGGASLSVPSFVALLDKAFADVKS